MADEFQHKDPGSELTQAEFITTDGTGHIFQSQATGDILYASSATVLKALPIADNGDVLSLAAGIPAWTASAAVATKVTVTDNEDTAENNLVTFVAGAATATGAQSLEMDGHLTYNPSTGTLTATVFVGALTGTASNVTTNANLTGHVTSSGNAAVLGSFTSAQLATALTNETGTGLAVFNGSPVLTTPTIGSFANSAHDHSDTAGGAAVVSASATVSGIAELATTAEINTGDDTGRVITPKALADSALGERVIQMVCVDFATALTTGSKFYFHVPSTLNGFNIVDVHGETLGDPSGSTIIIDLHNVTQSDASVLSGKLTIGIGYFGSDESGGSVTIDTGEDLLATNDVLRVDIDQIGSGDPGTGLIVTLICRLP